jgi:hypothetical protein
MIGKTIQQRIDGGKWQTWGVVENDDEARAIEARIKLGNHAINGGQNTCEFRVRPYRGRNDRSTRHNRDSFDRIKKLGRLKYIKGYRYFGRYHTSHEAVLVVGEFGSIRFGGLLWGYSGEGPRGLHELLLKVGVPSQKASSIAFHAPRLEALGEDWRLTLEWQTSPAWLGVA